MYHETIAQLCKMTRLTLPFLGQYEWVHKTDKRFQPAQAKPVTRLSSILAEKPAQK